MRKKYLVNNKGFTLIEMMVATAVGVLILGATVLVFSRQDALLRSQNADAELRGLGRIAIQQLAQGLRNAGADIPLKARFLTATASSFSFRTNAKLDPSTLTVTAADSQADVILGGVSDLTVGQEVVIYAISDMTESTSGYELGNTISAINTGTNTVTLTSNLANAYPAFTTFFNPYDTFTYTYDSGTSRITKTVNGTVIPFIGDVSSLVFTYKDENDAALPFTAGALTAANRELIRKIEVTMTLTDPNASAATMDLRTDIYLRSTG